MTTAGRPELLRGMWLAASLLLGGCGTQFSDPIRERQTSQEVASGGGAADEPASVICTDEPVQSFDGTAFATLMRPIQDDFTIELWIKTDQSLTGTGAYVGNPLVFADAPTVTTDDFGASLLNGKFQMATGNPDAAVRSTSDVTTNEWVHLAATRERDSGVVLVFVNGVLEGTGLGNSNSLSASTVVNLGGRADREFFVGLMSEVRLWSTVRTQGQIVANMHRRLRGSEGGLVGYYRLDDQATGVLHDTSPSENHATLDVASVPVTSDPPICGP